MAAKQGNLAAMKIRIVLDVDAPDDALAQDFATKMKRLKTAIRWLRWMPLSMKVVIP